MHSTTPRLRLSEAHALWLETERGLSCETSAGAGIVSRPNDPTAIGFVYSRGGQPTHVKWRTLDKTRMWAQPAGIAPYLWGLDDLAEASGKGDTLIITEGEFDRVAWMTVGAPWVVSVPNGSSGKPGAGDIDPTNDSGFAYLWNGGKLIADVDKFDRIILSTDNDEPGHILRDELAIRLGRERCWWPQYPAHCKDANDVLKAHGMEGLGRLLRSCRPMVPDRLVPFDAIPRRMLTDGLTSGWPDLDRNLRFAPPELVVVTGTPGAGKSQWVLALVCNFARLHGMRGAILQFEDHPDRNRRNIEAYARTWADQKKGLPCPPDEWVSRMFLAIPPPERDDADEVMDIAWLERVITEAARRHGCRWVVIDPWNEVEHVWRVNESETAYTNQALRELKRLSRKLQIILIVVTHPAKSAASKSIDDLSLYDVSGSAAWKNKADHGIVIHRPDPSSSETIVKVDKSKDFELLGIPGVVRMQYHAGQATYGFLSRD